VVPSRDRPRHGRHRRPRAWERATEVFCGPVPASDVGFVHRDFHPGNLLWSRGHLSGVVDWQSACLGPASIDPGHCRLNMLYYDAALADELRQAWELRSGRAFDPWADIMSIIGALDHLRRPKEPSPSRLAIEDALARAVADLGADGCLRKLGPLVSQPRFSSRGSAWCACLIAVIADDVVYGHGLGSKLAQRPGRSR
jgi:hypothetical protein